MKSLFSLSLLARYFFNFLFVIATTTYLSNGAVKAADFTLSNSAFCQVKLAGVIANGDTGQLIRFVKDKNVIDPENDEIGYSLCLDSPGGSFNEAMVLARYFQTKVVSTVIDRNAACLSACAVAFMFGTEAAGDFIGSKRAMHFSARLGFHRPALKVPNRADYTDEQIEKALKVILDSVVNLMVEANRVQFNHSQPIMASDLIQHMFNHEGNDFYEIETVDQAGRWNIQVLGWTPPERFALHHAHNACMNLLSWPVGFTSHFKPFNYAAGIRASSYSSFDFIGDRFGMLGFQTAEKSGDVHRIALTTPSTTGDDNGSGQCIFAMETSKLNTNFNEAENPLGIWRLKGCGSDSSTSVDFGEGECTLGNFEEHPFGEDFSFDQYLRAIAIANPKSRLSDLASQKAFQASEFETDCFVLNNGSELERNRCKASVEKDRSPANPMYSKIFVWPSGSKTVISYRPDRITINGRSGITRKDTNTSRFVECVTNTRSGNEFCHGLREN